VPISRSRPRRLIPMSSTSSASSIAFKTWGEPVGSARHARAHVLPWGTGLLVEPCVSSTYSLLQPPARPSLRVLLYRLGTQDVGLGVPFKRGLEIARSRASRSEGFQIAVIIPLRQLARHCRRLDGLFPVAVFLVGAGGPDPRAEIVSTCVFGVQSDSLGEISDRLVVVLRGGPGGAAVIVRSGVLGVKLDGLGVIGDCLRIFLFVRPGIAAAVEGGRVSRIDPDSVGVIGDRLVVLLLVGPCLPIQEGGAGAGRSFLGSCAISSPQQTTIASKELTAARAKMTPVKFLASVIMTVLLETRLCVWLP
jgi:hypothetical protein